MGGTAVILIKAARVLERFSGLVLFPPGLILEESTRDVRARGALDPTWPSAFCIADERKNREMERVTRDCTAY